MHILVKGLVFHRLIAVLEPKERKKSGVKWLLERFLIIVQIFPCFKENSLLQNVKKETEKKSTAWTIPQKEITSDKYGYIFSV